MNQDQVNRIRQTFETIAHRTPELADRFHARLFAQNPPMRMLFPKDLSAQKQDFSATLRLVVKNLHRLESIEGTLMDIGAKQFRMGLTPGHYGIAREVLLATLRDMIGPAWTPETQSDWTEALNVVVSLLVVGGGRARVQAA